MTEKQTRLLIKIPTILDEFEAKICSPIACVSFPEISFELPLDLYIEQEITKGDQECLKVYGSHTTSRVFTKCSINHTETSQSVFIQNNSSDPSENTGTCPICQLKFSENQNNLHGFRYLKGYFDQIMHRSDP